MRLWARMGLVEIARYPPEDAILLLLRGHRKARRGPVALAAPLVSTGPNVMFWSRRAACVNVRRNRPQSQERRRGCKPSPRPQCAIPLRLSPRRWFNSRTGASVIPMPGSGSRTGRTASGRQGLLSSVFSTQPLTKSGSHLQHEDGVCGNRKETPIGRQAGAARLHLLELETGTVGSLAIEYLMSCPG